MSEAASLRVLGYRFRATFGDRWGGYLAIVLLVGLVGGLALGAVAAARRTQAAFPAYLASTNPTDLTVLTGAAGPARPGYDPALIRRIAALPHVRRVESYAGLNVAILAPNGASAVNATGLLGSIDGEFFDSDQVTIVQGRMADPRRADEAVIDAKGSPSRVHVGEVVPLGFYTSAQVAQPGFGRPGMKPYLRINVKVVGKALFSREVAQDDIDTELNGGPLFTPALTRLLARCCAGFTQSAVRLDHAGEVAATEAAIERILPRGFPVLFYVTSLTEAKAERAIEPASIALGVFGGIAALAALLIAGQVIGRQLRLGGSDLDTLRALGARPAVTVGDGLPGVLGAIVAGSLLAAAVAVGLSPLAPLGSVRTVYPYPGVAFDWTVLGAGMLALAGVLSLVAVTLAYRRAPHRVALRHQQARLRGSAVVRAASASGLPPPAVEGIRFALDPGTGRDTVPVRSAILGTALAMIVLIATVTFGASLGTLVSHPALYGWNWTYALCSCGSSTSIPRQRAAALLDHDPAVAGWTGIYFATFRIDGLTVPVIGASPNAAVGPPLLSGHALQAADQVVLGPATLAQLHKHVGDEVTVLNGASRRSRLRIAGTATLPSLGVSETLHTEMGTGAVLSYQLVPRAASSQPNIILVTLRPGANAAAERNALQRLVPAAEGGQVKAVQRPAEIVNYRSMGTTPLFLGAALAAGALTALGLTLIASVRRRRRDLALLKTLGFTRRQLAAVVTWQSSVAVAAGTMAGVPAGIALGRFLWYLFARQISVVPEPTVPGLPVILIAAGALVLANIVAVIPGRVAGRTPAGLLRTE